MHRNDADIMQLSRNGKALIPVRLQCDAGAAVKIADAPDGVNTLAVPQIAPEKFLPVAWGNKGKSAIRVLAVPAGKP